MTHSPEVDRAEILARVIGLSTLVVGTDVEDPSFPTMNDAVWLPFDLPAVDPRETAAYCSRVLTEVTTAFAGVVMELGAALNDRGGDALAVVQDIALRSARGDLD